MLVPVIPAHNAQVRGALKPGLCKWSYDRQYEGATPAPRGWIRALTPSNPGQTAGPSLHTGRMTSGPRRQPPRPSDLTARETAPIIAHSFDTARLVFIEAASPLRPAAYIQGRPRATPRGFIRQRASAAHKAGCHPQEAPGRRRGRARDRLAGRRLYGGGQAEPAGGEPALLRALKARGGC